MYNTSANCNINMKPLRYCQYTCTRGITEGSIDPFQGGYEQAHRNTVDSAIDIAAYLMYYAYKFTS